LIEPIFCWYLKMSDGDACVVDFGISQAGIGTRALRVVLVSIWNRLVIFSIYAS
jgi:hypothetical protein